MWERLKQSDILQAKQELRQRVDATLRRHVDELRGLDTDLAEVETLNRLVDAFSDKFGLTPPEPAAPGKNAAASGGAAAGDKRASNVRQIDPAEPGGRGGPRTNFDAFSRAVAKTDRW